MRVVLILLNVLAILVAFVVCAQQVFLNSLAIGCLMTARML